MSEKTRFKILILYFIAAFILIAPIPGAELSTKLAVGGPLACVGAIPFMAFFSSNTQNFQAFCAKPGWTHVARIIFGVRRKSG